MKRLNRAILSPEWQYELAVRKNRTTILELNERGEVIDSASFGNKSDSSQATRKPLPGWMTAALEKGNYVFVDSISTENGLYRIMGYILGPDSLIDERRERISSINKFDGWKNYQSTEEAWGFKKDVYECVYKIFRLRGGEEVRLTCQKNEISSERVVQIEKSDLEKIGRVDLFKKRIILKEIESQNPPVTEEYPLSEWKRWILKNGRLVAVSRKTSYSIKKEIHYKDFDIEYKDGDSWKLSLSEEKVDIYDVPADFDLISTTIENFEVIEEFNKYGENTYESSDGFGGDRTVITCTNYVKVRVRVGDEEITVDAKVAE